jgi:heme/copper-type cytochrome/quinol oxidase subunit 3
MTSVVATAPAQPHEDVHVVGARWRTGVILIIVADAAFVASLIFSYFYLRGLNTEGGWLPKGSSTAAIWVGWAIAGGLVLSAAAYRWGQMGLHAGNAGRLVIGTAAAVLLVLADTVGQIIQLGTFPFRVDSGSYASSAFALAGASLFHLLITLFIGVGLWNRARQGKYTVASNWQVRVVGLWWSWIAIAAIASALTTSFIASPHIVVH